MQTGRSVVEVRVQYGIGGLCTKAAIAAFVHNPPWTVNPGKPD